MRVLPVCRLVLFPRHISLLICVESVTPNTAVERDASQERFARLLAPLTSFRWAAGSQGSPELANIFDHVNP
jgi:hypothetical protein